MVEPEECITLPRVELGILLLCDSWSSIRDGISGVNRSLALNLARYKGTKVYTTLFSEHMLTSHDKKEMADNRVQAIASIEGDVKKLYTKLTEDPLEVFPNLTKRATNVTHIVGHSPITAKAALKLKETTYPDAKLILFYHVVPHDLTWVEDKLPFVIPTDTEMIHMAEQADVVYSVTDKCHWFYTAKFRNRAETDIDHRIFYPQCSENVFDIPRHVHTALRPEILVLSDSTDIEDWLGLDIAGCAANKITQASTTGRKGPVPILKIGGITHENMKSVREKLVQYANHKDLQVKMVDYTAVDNLYKDLQTCSLCIIPSRAEPYGTVGLIAISSGIPTLISKDSNLDGLIARLTSDSENFTGRCSYT